MKVHLVAGILAGAWLIALPARAVDVTLSVQAQNATSLNTVSYFLGNGSATTPGASAQSPQVLSATGLSTGQQTLFTTFGDFTIDVAGDGTVTHVDGPFTVVGSVLTVQNTVDIGGTLTIVPRNPTAFGQVGYELRCIEAGNSDVGGVQRKAGSPATAAVYPFAGMAPGMDFYVFTSFSTLHFKIDAGGALVHGNSAIEGSQVPGDLFTIAGSTITIENGFGFTDLTVNTEQPTSVSLFGVLAADVGGFGTSIGPSATTPGSEAQTGVTLPFAGMTHYTNVYLFTTIGLLQLKIDASGAVTFGTSSLPGSGSYLLFSASGSTVTLKNRVDYPEVRFRTAAPTSLSAVSLELHAHQGALNSDPLIGAAQLFPGADALSGVTVPLFGVLPFLEMQLVSDFEAPFLKVDAAGTIVHGTSGTAGLNDTLLPAGSTVIIQNLLNFRLRITLDHASANPITYNMKSLSTHAIGAAQTLAAGQVTGTPDLEALGLTPFMRVQVNTSVGSSIFRLQPDGSAIFLSPGTNLSPTKGAISIESGTNTLYMELLPLPPKVMSVSPAPNALEVSRSTNVTVSFSERVDPATVTASTFHLLDPLGAIVAATPPAVSPSELQATLNPTSPLAPDTLYTVEVTSGVEDLDGNAATPFISRFRTAAASGSGGVPLPDVSTPTSPIPPAAGSAEAGHAVARLGDLDGDGIADFVSGAPGYTVQSAFGRGPSAAEAGAALIYFGSGDAAESAAPDIIFEGVDPHDRVGVSVAGDFDFNGDGLRDIVIGAEQVDRTDPGNPVPTGKGKVYVIFFDPHDTVHYPNIEDPSIPDVVSLALVGQPGGIPGIVFEGAAFGDQAGFSVAAGGTSKAGGGTDILIGAPGADPGGRTDAGAAYVVFDNATLSGDVSLSRVSDGLPDQIPGKAYYGENAGDNLGYGTAFTGPIIDGQDASTGAVIMTAPGGQAHAGKAIIAAGDPDTTPIVVDAVGTTHSGVTIVGSQPGDGFGVSVADGGDALADGIPDLLIGAPGHDVGAMGDAGEVVQISAVLPSGTYGASEVGTTIPGVIWEGAAAGDELGVSVAGVGDVTGDGYDDVAFGAPFADAGSIAEAGAVYLVYGEPASLVTQGTISVGAIGTQVAGEVFVGTETGEHAGSAVAGVGDLDGDGDADFVVGAPDLDGQTDPNAGSAYAVAAAPPPPGNCTPGGGCVVSDLSNGAEIDVPAGALATTTTLGTTGILDAGSLPAAVPPGKMLYGAAIFTPDGQTIGSPFATIYLPTVAQPGFRRAPAEVLPLFSFDGAGWVLTGVDGTTVTNPSYADRIAVQATVGTLRTYAVFVNDADGDQVRDELDNCPTLSNGSQLDTDHDGIGDACECLNVSCGDGNPCTDDACDPTSGACLHVDNAAACDDGDPCTVGDTCSSGACLPGGSITPPPEVQNLSASADKVTLSWSAAASATTYDVVRGSTSGLPVGPGSGDEVCFPDLLSAQVADGSTPPDGTAYWYLSRGRNACGAGTYGQRSNGSPRLTSTCP